MRTQSIIRKDITELQKEIIDIRGEMFKNKELKELQKKIHFIKEEYDEKAKQCYERIYKLKEELRKTKEKKLIKIPEYLRDWLVEYQKGVDFGSGELKIVWFSEDGRFVILTRPGFVGWAARGEQSYAKAEHWAVDTESSKSYLEKYRMKGKKLELKFEGRLTKEKKQQLLNEIEQYKRDLSL